LNKVQRPNPFDATCQVYDSVKPRSRCGRAFLVSYSTREASRKFMVNFPCLFQSGNYETPSKRTQLKGL